MPRCPAGCDRGYVSETNPRMLKAGIAKTLCGTCGGRGNVSDPVKKRFESREAAAAVPGSKAQWERERRKRYAALRTPLNKATSNERVAQQTANTAKRTVDEANQILRRAQKNARGTSDPAAKKAVKDAAKQLTTARRDKTVADKKLGAAKKLTKIIEKQRKESK